MPINAVGAAAVEAKENNSLWDEMKRWSPTTLLWGFSLIYLMGYVMRAAVYTSSKRKKKKRRMEVTSDDDGAEHGRRSSIVMDEEDDDDKKR